MRRYRLTDLVLFAHLGIVGLLLVVARERASTAWPVWLAVHAAVALLVAGLVRHDRTGAAGWLRELYPLPLFVLLYRESAALNHTFFAEPLDPWFFRAEEAWFGGQPSLAFAQRWPQTWVAEILYGTYFSFYVMIVGMGGWLVARHRAAARHFLAVLTVVFCTCYLVFIALPVVGPRILETGGLPTGTTAALGLNAVPPMPPSTQAGPFAILMRFLYTWFEGEGGAFPSSHVIVACLTVRFSFLYARPVRWIHATLAVALCFGTVYGRYHYVLDVLAALVLTIPLIAGAEWLRRGVED